jgi:hypothetical protein
MQKKISRQLYRDINGLTTKKPANLAKIGALKPSIAPNSWFYLYGGESADYNGVDVLKLDIV